MQPLTGREEKGRDRRPRLDPAPSILAYRMQRWLLTPMVRTGLRHVLPAVSLLGITVYYLGDADHRTVLVEGTRAILERVRTHPEFMVTEMSIKGASPELAGKIRNAAGIRFPFSYLDFDLDELRDVLHRVREVKRANLRVHPSGILEIDIIERVPVVVWRNRSGLELLDKEGVSVADIPGRALRPDLPLVTGDGVQPRIKEALRLVDAARPLGGRLRGLVRVGERRWDVVLDHGQRILLPDERPLAALDQVIHLHQSQSLLTYGLEVIDMRLPNQLTLRHMAEAPSGDRRQQVDQEEKEEGT